MIVRYLALLIIGALFMSCDKDSGDTVYDDEFRQNKRKWEDANIVDYSIQENYSCYCGGLLEWEIVIKNSTKDTLIFDISRLSENETYEMIVDKARTVEDAFDFIENFDSETVYLFEVDYHDKYGFPTRIYIDRDERLADDEIGYLYSSFKPEN